MTAPTLQTAEAVATAATVTSVLTQLSQAGLNLSLAPAGGLALAPASNLTADLRDLILSHKALLIDWLTAANDAAYHVHHFNCPTCIAAGRGSRYGQRCGAGMTLWRACGE
jgi:hypothetical protein